MRITAVSLHNFRGFCQRRPVDLDGDVVLLYGRNGRGKSTVFSALELALFPDETLAELRREHGERAPLTNLYYEGPDRETGEIVVTLTSADGQTSHISQDVSQDLNRIRPSPSPVVQALRGQRSRLFFTQRLLRDLMFGTAERRHERVKQLLGGDGYDELLSTLYDWHRDREFESQQLVQQIDLVDQVAQVREQVRGDLPEEAFTAVFREGEITRHSALRLLRRLRESVLAEEPSNSNFLKDSPSLRRFGAVLEKVTRAVSRTRTLQRELAAVFEPVMLAHGGRIELRTTLPLPGPWRESLAERLSNRPPKSSTEDEQRQWASDTADLATEYIETLSRLRARLLGWIPALQRLTKLDPVLDLMAQESRVTSGKTRAILSHRYRFLTYTRLLYAIVLEQVELEMSQRIRAIHGQWNLYYRAMSPYGHFQQVDLEIARTYAGTESWTQSPDRWSWVRFRVRDQRLGPGAIPFAMESVLSEGQLNCAIVSLALALGEANWTGGSTPLSILALDDPFVSWDDVNMENFMLSVRHLALRGTSVLLSTCDERVVHSLRRNMETAGLKRLPRIHSFNGWTPDGGPVLTTERVERRKSEYAFLRQLPEGTFKATRIAPDDHHLQIDRPPSSEARSERYYILTTTSAACLEQLRVSGRFDHLYAPQPDSKPLLDLLTETEPAEWPEIHFVLYDRVRGSSTYRKLSEVYKLQALIMDREAGPTTKGQTKYSLMLERVGSIGRDFDTGSGLWESLSVTRGRRLVDLFFPQMSRVIIPLSAADYNKILGLR